MTGPRVRVLHVITRLVVGGAQENTLLTVEHLSRTRYDAVLASGPTSGPEGTLEGRLPSGIPFERIPELVRYPHPVLDGVALWRLATLIRRLRPDIVHTHTTKAGILGRVAARIARAPIVVHTPHGHAFHDYLNSVGSRALRQMERWLARRTNAIICLTEAERQDHIRLGIGPPEQFEVIHSGVDLLRFGATPGDPLAKRRELALPADGPLVGCVARLVPVKGVDYLLEATPHIRRRAPRATVVFVGDGPLRPALQRRAAQLNLNGAVVFLGLRDDVEQILPIFDVVVMPSLNEGMGKAVIEAMAAGRPVVGSAVSGIRDVIAHERTGLLVPPADPQALAGAVAACLSDPAMAASLARNARSGLESYGIEPMITKIEALYERLLERD